MLQQKQGKGVFHLKENDNHSFAFSIPTTGKIALQFCELYLSLLPLLISTTTTMNDNDNSRVCIIDTIVKECFSDVDVMPSILKLLSNDTPTNNDNNIHNHVKSISKIRDVCTPS